MKQISEEDIQTRTCKYCKTIMCGVLHEGFLWPNWMQDDHCWAFPPHGPRIFNIKKMMCWKCGIAKSLVWHK